jgi:preprotein translocase subunit SecG
MENIIPIAQIALAVILMALILLQQRGAGLGSAFGQSGGFYATQRGLQKKIYWATLVAGALFVALAVYNLFQK